MQNTLISTLIKKERTQEICRDSGEKIFREYLPKCALAKMSSHLYKILILLILSLELYYLYKGRILV